MRRTRLTALAIVVASACSEKSPPSPRGAQAATSAMPTVTESSTDFLFQYVGADGASKEVSKVADVPAEHRARVRVIPLRSALPPPGKTYVADLTKSVAGAGYTVSVVPLAEFAGRKEESSTSTGTGTTTSAPTNTGEGGVILYATSWCGVCEKARSYFRRRKIDYVEKDIEKDPAAAAEMQRKASTQGVSTRGVPVIDVRGTMLAGFDPQRIERLLAR